MPELVYLPSGEMERLKPLVGDWIYKDGSATFRSGPGGFALLVDEVCREPEGTRYCHGVLTWEPKEGLYRCILSDNLRPGTRVLEGRWEERQLRLEERGGDPAARRRVTLSSITPESFEMTLEVLDPIGISLPLARRSYHRKAGGAGAPQPRRGRR